MDEAFDALFVRLQDVSSPRYLAIQALTLPAPIWLPTREPN